MCGPVVVRQGTGEICKVACPARFCLGVMVELINGRIAEHDSPLHPGCDWTGTRVVPDPGLTQQLARTMQAKGATGA
jgi:hypothetical protein